MRVLVISHAYAASYNRRDKLARLARRLNLSNRQTLDREKAEGKESTEPIHQLEVKELAVIIPQNWQDKMQKISRKYEKIPEDNLYRVELLKPIFNSIQNRYFYYPWSLNKVVRDFQPDIIHIEQELHDWVLWEVTLLNRLFWRRPLVIFVWENICRKFNPVKRLIMRWAAGQMSHFICGNGGAVEVVRGYLKGMRVKSASGQLLPVTLYQLPFTNRLKKRLLPKTRSSTGNKLSQITTLLPQFGVDTKRFRPLEVNNLKKKLELKNKFVIGYVGRFVREKGAPTLITAIEKLAGDKPVPEFSLLLLSSMAPPDWLLTQTEKLGDKVRFAGRIPHKDFPKYMNLFDVLILPSETQKDWKEQFGRVMVEVMACGVPVIGSSSGAIPEVLGSSSQSSIGDAYPPVRRAGPPSRRTGMRSQSEFGIIFQEKDSDDLAKKIKQLMQDREKLEALKGRVRPYVEGKFSHEVIAKETVGVWRKVNLKFDSGFCENIPMLTKNGLGRVITLSLQVI